jgi:hypothetical protein
MQSLAGESLHLTILATKRLHPARMDLLLPRHSRLAPTLVPGKTTPIFDR